MPTKKKEINTNWKFVFKSCTWVWAYKYRLRTIIIIKESATWSELITQQEKKTQEQTTANKTISIQSTWLTIGYGNLQHFILCFALSAPVFFSFFFLLPSMLFTTNRFFVVVNWDDKNLQWTFSLTKNMLVSWRPSASEQVQQVRTNKRYWNSNYDYFLKQMLKVALLNRALSFEPRWQYTLHLVKFFLVFFCSWLYAQQ